MMRFFLQTSLFRKNIHRTDRIDRQDEMVGTFIYLDSAVSSYVTAQTIVMEGVFRIGDN